jgi:phosphoribosylaminoimidazolecarboxamide formyltransferase/IMP cyclohydrolase
MRQNPEHMRQIEEQKVGLIDVVAINLYPFKQTIMQPGVTLEDAVENIDIGGPTMLRAAAKNWQDVIVLADPADYSGVIEQLKAGEVSREKKFSCALKVFEHTAAYDAMIAQYLRGDGELPEKLTLTFEKVQDMRYGENPHQKAVFYKEAVPSGNTGPADAKQLHGKELSFLNINDANGALDMLKDMDSGMCCAVAVKHANPCGVGMGDTIFEAYMNAFEADPVSIFGGIVAMNREIDGETARELAKIYLEIIIAPSYSPQALEILGKKKDIRLLELPGLQKPLIPGTADMKKVTGGLLVQDVNTKIFGDGDFKTVTNRAPTAEESEQLRFAWRLVKHVKSNGICLVKGRKSIGIGPGQTNRVTALDLAIRYAGDSAKGSVMASDAFFPFADCVQIAAKAGITAIIQPGGSMRDEDSIKACNEAGIAMVFTGMRHFKH